MRRQMSLLRSLVLLLPLAAGAAHENAEEDGWPLSHENSRSTFKRAASILAFVSSSGTRDRRLRQRLHASL